MPAPTGGARERIARACSASGAIDDRIQEELLLHKVVGADAVALEGRLTDVCWMRWGCAHPEKERRTRSRQSKGQSRARPETSRVDDGKATDTAKDQSLRWALRLATSIRPSDERPAHVAPQVTSGSMQRAAGSGRQFSVSRLPPRRSMN